MGIGDAVDFTPSPADPYLVDERDLVRGWPGFRTRYGRTGLDYVDTSAEMGHMAGVGARQLLTGSWLDSPDGVSPWSAFIVAFMGVSFVLSPLAVLILTPVGLVLHWMSRTRVLKPPSD